MESRRNHGRKKKKKVNYLLYRFLELMNRHKSKNLPNENCFEDRSYPSLVPTLKPTNYSFENPFPHIRNSAVFHGEIRRTRLKGDLFYSNNYNIPGDHTISQQLLNTLNQRTKETNLYEIDAREKNLYEIDLRKKTSNRKTFNFLSVDFPQFPLVPIERNRTTAIQDGMGETFRKSRKIRENKIENQLEILDEEKIENRNIDGSSVTSSTKKNPGTYLNREISTSLDCQHLGNINERSMQCQRCRWQTFSNGEDNWPGSTRTKTPGRSREILGLRRRRKKEFVKKCFLDSKYSSTSDDEFAPTHIAHPDGMPVERNLILRGNKSVERRDSFRRSSKLQEQNQMHILPKQPKTLGLNDSDFGFRDYDTCVDSDDEGSEGTESGSSSRYDGGITSNLSLFSSVDSDVKPADETFEVWDSDEQIREKKRLLDSNSKSLLDSGSSGLEKKDSSLLSEGRKKNLISVEKEIKKREFLDKIQTEASPYCETTKKRVPINHKLRNLNLNCHISPLTDSRHLEATKSDNRNNSFFYGKSLHENTFNLHNKNIFQSCYSALNDFTLDRNQNTAEEDTNSQLQKSFSTLKGEVAELSSKLERVSQERDLFESSLTTARLNQIQNERETCSRLDGVTQQYEERLTELHSVIAELTRKLERRNDDVIIEEEEEDVEEIKDRRKKREKQDGDEEKKSLSEYSSKEQNETTEYSTSETADSEAIFDAEESHDVTNRRPQTDASTSCEIDDRAVEAGECIADLDVSVCKGTSSNSNDAMCQGSSSVGLEEEVKVLREEKHNLTQALLVAQHNISSQRSIMLALTRESEAFKIKLKEYQRMQPAIPISCPQISDAKTIRGLRQSPIFGILGGSASVPQEGSRARSPSSASMRSIHEESYQMTGQDDFQVICKLAERVRLKKAMSGDQRVTGSELSSVGIYTTGVAEQLVASLQEESDAQELFHALATGGGAFAPHELLKECELEAERLHSRIDHLKAQNDVLGATLSESKAHCDRLALMTGKAEAQTGALKMGVEVLDRIQEAYEILSALQEAQICFLIATCRMAGVQLETDRSISDSLEGIELDPLSDLKRAQEQRRTAENVTRHLLSRLENSKSKMQNGTSENDGNNDSMDVSCERKIRNAIQALQEERIRILSCLKGVADSSPTDEYFPPSFPLSMEEAHKLDLENAVLMQELTAIREDRAELRAQVYLLEREKAGLELRTGTCEAQTAAYCITINHLKEELEHHRNPNSQESTGDSGVESSSCEADSLRREKQLRSRVEDLVTTLETITKNSEARHRQSQEFISDLKKANSALLTAVDRLKKKYSLRVKRMEQQAINMVEKHAQQMKLLKHRIEALEDQLGAQANLQKSTTSETSF